MLAQEMSLNFEEEVVMRLIGYHVGGPSISVGFPSFILPFYTTETNGSRRLTDMLKVCAGCCRREIGSCGARVRVEPFLHVDLELVLGLLVFKDVGHLSGAPVVRGGRFVELLGGGPGIRKEFQNSRWLSDMVAGERARCRPSSCGMVGPWKMRMWSIQETGVMEVHLVRILVDCSWSVMVLLGLHQPIRLAQR